MYILHGKSISPGKGTGFLHSLDSFGYSADELYHNNLERELERFQKARADALNQLQSLYERAIHKVDEAEAKIFVIQQMMVHDMEFTGKVRDKIKEGFLAEYAVSVVAAENIEQLEATGDDYMMARTDDVRDLSSRVIRNLTGQSRFEAPTGSHFVIYKETIVPSEIIEFDPKCVLAIITESGSQNSHSSILARALGIPYITSVKEDISKFEGRRTTVDADNDTITIITSKNTITTKKKDCF